MRVCAAPTMWLQAPRCLALRAARLPWPAAARSGTAQWRRRLCSPLLAAAPGGGDKPGSGVDDIDALMAKYGFNGSAGSAGSSSSKPTQRPAAAQQQRQAGA
jgi:hypothetical protein